MIYHIANFKMYFIVNKKSSFMMNININKITRIFKHFVSALVRRRGNFLYIAPLNITFEEELGKQKFNIGIVN